MPIFSAIGAAIGAVSSFIGGIAATGIGKAIIGIGLQIASAALQKAFVKKPASGTSLDVSFGEDAPALIAFGTVGVSGHLVAAWTTGPNNRDLIHVYALSRFPAHGFSRVWINGRLETLGAADPDMGFPVTSGDYVNLMWIKFIDGRQTAADPYLVAAANPADIWTASHVGTGVAYAVVTMRYHKDWLTSVPTCLFEMDGARLYDWRKDTTVGGSGPHRFNDQTTWEFSRNPVVMAYNYHRGLRVNGLIIGGMEVDPLDLPLGKWTLAANICDEMVGSRRRYECSVLVDLGAEHRDNIDAIMRSCGGAMVLGIGEVWPRVGTANPIVATITDDDFVTGEAVTFQAKRSFNDLVNSVSGTHPSPESAWNAVSYRRAVSTAALTADRRTRDVSINYDTVSNAEQAAQLAAIALSENRYQRTASMTLRPRWQGLEPGDWIQWNSDQAIRTGVYEITAVEITSNEDDSGPRNVRVSAQERDGAIYTSVGTVTPPVIINPALPVYQQELQSFTVTAATISGANGVLQAAIRCGWATPIDPTVAGAIMEYRVKSGPADAIFTRTITNGAVVAILSEGVVRNTVYEVRHRLITDPSRAVSPSAWIEVTTNDVGMDWASLGQDVRNFLTGMDDRLDEVIDAGNRSAWHDTLAMAATLAESAKHAVETGGNFARASRETRVLARADAVLAQNVTELSVGLAGTASAELLAVERARVTQIDGVVTAQSTQLITLDARILTAEGNAAAAATAVNQLQTTVTQQGNSITALATADTALTARVGNVDAGTLFQMTAEAAPSGYSSQIAMFARGTVGGVTTFAGLRIRVSNAGQGEIILAADRTFISDSAGNVVALFTSSGATINSARIANLSAANFTAGTITANSVVAGSIVSSSMSIGASANPAGMSATPSGTPSSGGSDVVMQETTLQFDATTGTLPVLIDSLASAVMSWGSNSGGNRTMTFQLRVDDRNGNGRVLSTVSVSSTSTSTGSMTASLVRFVLDNAAAPRADGTVRYYYTLASVYDSGMSVSANTQARMAYWKR